MTPNELLLAAAAGDHRAFVELCERMDFSLQLIVRGHVHEQHQIETVTQAVRQEAWRTAGSFDPAEMSASQWMLSLARRRAAERARRLRRLPADRVVRSLRRDGAERGSVDHLDGSRMHHDPLDASTPDPRRDPVDPVARQLRRLRAQVAKLVA